MSTESPNNQRKDYTIPCQLLPATDFDMSEAIPAEKLAGVAVGGFVRDELLHETAELDLSSSAGPLRTGPVEADIERILSFEYEDLKRALSVSDTTLEHVALGPVALAGSAVRTRGSVLTELDGAIRLLLEWAKIFGPYVALGLWVAQAFFSRQRRYQLLIARVVGIVGERGFSDAETTAVKEIASKELLRLGLPADKANWASNRVVQVLARELKPRVEIHDTQAIADLVKRIQELVAYFPGWAFEKKPYGCCVQVPVPGARRHAVHVVSKPNDKAGRPMVEFQAICGKANPEFLERILRRSARLQLGSFSIRKKEDTEYFVLQHRVRLEEVSQSALNRILPCLAEQADQVQAELKA